MRASTSVRGPERDSVPGAGVGGSCGRCRVSGGAAGAPAAGPLQLHLPCFTQCSVEQTVLSAGVAEHGSPAVRPLQVFFPGLSLCRHPSAPSAVHTAHPVSSRRDSFLSSEGRRRSLPAEARRLLGWSEQLEGAPPLPGPWVCRENALFKAVITLRVTSWWPPELRFPEDLKMSYLSLEFDGPGSCGEDTYFVLWVSMKLPL